MDEFIIRDRIFRIISDSCSSFLLQFEIPVGILLPEIRNQGWILFCCLRPRKPHQNQLLPPVEYAVKHSYCSFGQNIIFMKG